MTVDELVRELQALSTAGHGDRQVIIHAEAEDTFVIEGAVRRPDDPEDPDAVVLSYLSATAPPAPYGYMDAGEYDDGWEVEGPHFYDSSDEF